MADDDDTSAHRPHLDRRFLRVRVNACSRSKSSHAPRFGEKLGQKRGATFFIAGPMVDYGVVPFEMMVRDADLIVACPLSVGRTYLSNDEREMYTEYVAAPTKIFAQRHSTAKSTPGPNPILIKHWGGRTEIEGVEVIAEEGVLRLLPTDVPLILFLLYDGATNRYRVYAHSIGAVAVEGTRVRPLFQKSFDTQRFEGMHYQQFVRAVIQNR